MRSITVRRRKRLGKLHTAVDNDWSAWELQKFCQKLKFQQPRQARFLVKTLSRSSGWVSLAWFRTETSVVEIFRNQFWRTITFYIRRVPKWLACRLKNYYLSVCQFFKNREDTDLLLGILPCPFLALINAKILLWWTLDNSWSVFEAVQRPVDLLSSLPNSYT